MRETYTQEILTTLYQHYLTAVENEDSFNSVLQKAFMEIPKDKLKEWHQDLWYLVTYGLIEVDKHTHFRITPNGILSLEALERDGSVDIDFV